MPYTLWTSRQGYDVCMKRKNKIVITSLVSLVVGAVALYAYSLHESFSEFDDAFLFIEGEKNIVLSQSEYEKTKRLLEEKWAWATKHTPEDENFSIISIDGYECVRIWSSQPRALLTSTHPLETYDPSSKGLHNFSTYNCMKNLDLDNFDGEFYLYGQPFFYDDKWWLYKPFEPRMKLIWFVCADGCSTHWQAFAKPEPILKSDPIYLEK